MCSTANYVLPLRRTCEAFGAPGRKYGGGPMSSFQGVRPHGTADDMGQDMDLAWQELMTITDLQGFDVPAESSYETPPYNPVEPLALVGAYGLAPSRAAPAVACEPNAAQYEELYSEVGPACHHPDATMFTHNNITTLSARSQRTIAPTYHGSAREQMKMDCATSRRTNMLWTAHRPHMHHNSVEDLESESGHSLGSSPPLASPDDGQNASTSYPNADLRSVTFSNGPTHGPDQTSRPHSHYPGDFQQNPLYSQPVQNDYLPPQPCFYHEPSSLTHVLHKHPHYQGDTLNVQQTDGSGMSSRGGSPQSTLAKQQGAHSTPVHLSRDERRAMALKIPFTVEAVINLPVDDFNELLTQHSLSESQLALVRDIRRRGKNKVAAQNCRKRKLQNIVHLEGELDQLQAKKEQLAQQRITFQHRLAVVKCHLTDLYSKVFTYLKDENGQPFSTDEYSLQQTADEKVYLVPQSTMQGRPHC